MKKTMMMTATAMILAGSSALAGEQLGSFRLERNVDPISDATRTLALSLGEQNKLSLAWRCMDDGLNVSLGWNKYLMGHDNGIDVAYRFPPAAAVTAAWDMATNHRAGFIPMRQVSAFTAKALQAQSVLVRVVDRDGETITDTVSLDGLDQVLKQLPCAKKVVATH